MTTGPDVSEGELARALERLVADLAAFRTEHRADMSALRGETLRSDVAAARFNAIEIELRSIDAKAANAQRIATGVLLAYAGTVLAALVAVIVNVTK